LNPEFKARVDDSGLSVFDFGKALNYAKKGYLKTYIFAPTGYGKIPIRRHSCESGRSEGIEKIGSSLPREWHNRTGKDFFSALNGKISDHYVLWKL
jgi:hypothetical protein